MVLIITHIIHGIIITILIAVVTLITFTVIRKQATLTASPELSTWAAITGAIREMVIQIQNIAIHQLPATTILTMRQEITVAQTEAAIPVAF